MTSYDRFGGLTPGAFLGKWWKPDPARPSWRYPDYDGFLLDALGRPVNSTVTLRAGSRVDRFGSEGGRFLGSADAPFAQRALPPDALNVCEPPKLAAAAAGECRPKDHPWGYHVYEVFRDFNVSAGPIAPAFEQPGLGVQFYVGDTGRVYQLVEKGLLKPLNLSRIHNGPKEASSCGRNPIKCDCLPPSSNAVFSSEEL